MLGTLVSPLAGAPAGVVLVGAGLLAVIRDFDIISFGLPERRRQVPSNLYGLSLLHGAFVFGFELGTAVRTYMTSTAPYLLGLSLLLLQPSLALALSAGIGFAVGRFLTMFGRWVAGDRERWTSDVVTQRQWRARIASIATTLVFAGFFIQELAQ